MSIRHVTWALELEDARLRPSHKLTLVAFAHALDGRDPSSGTWIGLELVARQVGITYRNVRMAVKHLVECGLLEREERPGRSSVYRLPEIAPRDACIPGQEVTQDAGIPGVGMSASSPPRMSASSPIEGVGMSASSHPGCLHPRPRMSASPDPGCIRDEIHHPPPTPPPREPEPAHASTRVEGGGGGEEDFSPGESFAQSGRRLVEWWNTFVVPIDDRVLPTPTVDSEHIRMFRDRLREVPDLEERVVKGLDPVAQWVKSTITIPFVLKSQTALNNAMGGLYREKDRAKLEAIQARRKLEERLRRRDELKNRSRARATDEVIEVEHIPA